eukprot:228296-Prymnesium_polylepis.1
MQFLVQLGLGFFVGGEFGTAPVRLRQRTIPCPAVTTLVHRLVVPYYYKGLSCCALAIARSLSRGTLLYIRVSRAAHSQYGE